MAQPQPDEVTWFIRGIRVRVTVMVTVRVRVRVRVRVWVSLTKLPGLPKPV